MKHIPRHTHSIEIEFSMGKTFVLFRATFPVKPTRREYISNWYKRAKMAVADANGVPVWKIKGKHKVIESTHFGRIIMEWPGGFALDLPDDITYYDYKIILHYLEGVKMALQST